MKQGDGNVSPETQATDQKPLIIADAYEKVAKIYAIPRGDACANEF